MSGTNAELRKARVGTSRFAYVDRNPRAAGTPLVLLHGGCLDHRMWAHQFDAFPDRRVIAPDARGHGQSSTPDAPFRSCDDVTGLLDALEIEQAVLVGLSMGGGTAVDVALEHPDRVTGLVVSGVGTSEPDFGDPWSLDILATWQRTEHAGDVEGWLEAFLRFVPGPHREPAAVDPYVIREVRQMAWDTLTNHVTTDDHGIPQSPVRPTPVTRTWERLPSIDVPVLAIIGDLDADDHQRMARTLAETVPRGDYTVIENTAHYPTMERPVAFDSAVDHHLASRGL